MLGKRKRKSNDDIFNESKKIFLEPNESQWNFGLSYITLKLFSSVSSEYHTKRVHEALINRNWSELETLINMKKTLDEKTLLVIAEALDEFHHPEDVTEVILRLSKLMPVSNQDLQFLVEDLKRKNPNLMFTPQISIDEITSPARWNDLKVILYSISELNLKMPNKLVRVDKRKSGLAYSYLIEFFNGALGRVLELPIQNKLKKGYRRKNIKGSGVYGKVVVARDEKNKKYAVKIQKPRYVNYLSHWRSEVRKEHAVLGQLKELPIQKALVFSKEDKISLKYFGLWRSSETRHKAYIVEEYKDGSTLESYIKNSNLDLLSRLKIVVGLAQEVKKYHDILIAHLDIKPDNIIVNERNSQFQVSLIDPGLTENFESKDGSKKSFFNGRHHYHPIEFMKVLKLSIDIYSLGVIADELLNVEDTFIDKMLIQIESQILKRPEIDECCQYFEEMLKKYENQAAQAVSSIGSKFVNF